MLVLLALAGLLRPEAWVFSGLYWLYLALPTVRARRGAIAETPRSPSRLDAAAGPRVRPAPTLRAPPASSPAWHCWRRRRRCCGWQATG